MMNKRGFTMVELIVVIVIIAIIAMFGVNLYTKIYKSYDNAKVTYMLQSRTASAADVISARLSARIKDAVIGRKSSDNSFVSLDSVTEKHDILEWLGQASETRDIIPGKDGPGYAGWSGFIDLDNSDTGAESGESEEKSKVGYLVTQGSKIPESSKMIHNLSGWDNFGVVYKSSVVRDIQTAYGFKKDGIAPTNVAIGGPVDGKDEVIKITDSNGATQISNQYYQVYSAYAIVPINIKEYTSKGKKYKVFDLDLRYNYRPFDHTLSKDSFYDANGVSHAIIARNVTLFRFKDDNGAVAFKICVRRDKNDVPDDEVDYIVCKSEVVF